jgi:NAD(P)-dependent dehydrogenase (short-subunit alcohol dehydrogenase family)
MIAGRTVVVTGAAGALGRAVVANLLAADARVVAVDVSETALGALQPAPNLVQAAVDLHDEAATRGAMGQAVARFGRIDGLVCLAGGYFGDTPIADTPPARLREQLELNLLTAYTAIHAALPHLVAGGGGVILGVSSRPAVVTAPGAVAYGIAKLGVLKLMEQLALEYREQGVRANAILPSIIDTPANRRAMPDADPARWVRPEQIAAVLRFLLSDDAAIISGAAIPVYGRA